MGKREKRRGSIVGLNKERGMGRDEGMVGKEKGGFWWFFHKSADVLWKPHSLDLMNPANPHHQMVLGTGIQCVDPETQNSVESYLVSVATSLRGCQTAPKKVARCSSYHTEFYVTHMFSICFPKLVCTSDTVREEQWKEATMQHRHTCDTVRDEQWEEATVQHKLTCNTVHLNTLGCVFVCYLHCFFF